MNNRKILLSLTVELLNAPESNVMELIKKLMGDFKQDVGAFLRQRKLTNKHLNSSFIRETYAMEFEKMRLDVDLVTTPNTQNQVVQGFRIL